MTLIIVGTYFIVSVFVAAVSGVFLRLRREHQMMLRSKSRNGASSDDELESELAIRKLIRRLNGGTGETLASIAEAALTRKRMLEKETTIKLEQYRAVLRGQNAIGYQSALIIRILTRW